MKRFSWLILIVVFAMSLMPLSALAQDGEEYVSDDGLISLMLPEDWVAKDALEDFCLPGLAIANSEDALEEASTMMSSCSDEETDEGPSSGSVIILVLLLPKDLVSMMGLEMPEESDEVSELEGIATAFADSMAEGTEGDEDPTEIGEVEMVDLGEEGEAAVIAISDSITDGALYAFEPGEGILALFIAATAKDEYTEDLDETVRAIAESFQYAGTAEDLMAALMGGGMEGETTGSATDGESLVAERCTVCHSAERIENKMASGATREEWEATVDRMIDHGAQLNDEEREAVISYLAGES